MRAPVESEVTRLLHAWRDGDQEALNLLIPIVYKELRQIARRRLRAQPLEHSLQTTAVVREVYLKLAGSENLAFNNRLHFLAVCANMIRRILVDAARSRRSYKRGGDYWRIPFDEHLHGKDGKPDNVVELDDALNVLARIDRRKAQALELRFFGGLSVEETAEVLGVSRETVLRDWRMARAWLKSELGRASYG